MRKRQRKKNEKKYLPFYMDEVHLLFMTVEERKESMVKFLEMRKKWAFNKRYKDLKNSRKIYFHVPSTSQKERDFLTNTMKRVRKSKSIVLGTTV